ncbi:hypothetical protein RJ640_029239 [Escallonia rubra]|uniref:Uncharacterized protein n=1 Tax=Escallonia rubra TaxID=112253 RepID=A0AA88UV43_9ASTE|nr:hypothetical protein RJ640_029239 [Escallonia rubra]
MLLDAGHSLVDPRGRLLPRSYDVLGLYTTFIFQKPDPDVAPPLMTPLLKDTNHNHDEASVHNKMPIAYKCASLILIRNDLTPKRGWYRKDHSSPKKAKIWKGFLSRVRLKRFKISDKREWQGTVWRDDEKNGQKESTLGLGKITEQKGILGPGPADLRFSEAL